MLLEVCWRLRGPSGRVVLCGIYRDDAPGVEVRAGFSADDLLRSARVREIGAARDVADEWKEAVLRKGSFVEVTPSH